MKNANHRPAVLDRGDGRKMMVLGQDITVKLSSADTTSVIETRFRLA